jgi:hypothetical protein
MIQIISGSLTISANLINLYKRNILIISVKVSWCLKVAYSLLQKLSKSQKSRQVMVQLKMYGDVFLLLKTNSTQRPLPLRSPKVAL